MKKTIYTILLFTCLSISYYAFTSSGGAPVGNTGAPGDATCVSCHGGSPITSGTNWNNFSITTNVPAGGYTPGAVYTVTISHSIAGINKWGFSSVALNSSNTQAGSIAAGAGTQTSTFNGRTYVTHTSSSNTGTSGRSWSFTWTAPNPGTGNVTIYAAVNAANGNGASDPGDQIYTKSIVVSQFTNNPTAVIDGIPANGYVCIGDTLFLAGSGINSPTDFSWTFTGLPASTDQNPVVVFTTTGSKTITLVTSNAFGSSTTNAKTVNVVNKPTASPVPVGPVNICGGDSVLLSTSASSAFSFLWSPAGQTTPSILVRDSGTYSAKVTNPLTGCFVHTTPVKVNQLLSPVAILTTSADTICSNDSITLFSNQPFTNYRFLNNTVVLQNGNSSTVKTKLSAGTHQLGLVVTGANGCKSDTAQKQVVVVAPLSAPVLSCGPKTLSSVAFNWAAVANAVAYEVSVDTGHNWTLLPVDSNSYTIGGLNPNTNKQLWVRALSSGYCNRGDIGTLICTNGACTPISYEVSFVADHCLMSAQDSVMVPITVSNLNIGSYGISFANTGYGTSLAYSHAVKLGSNSVRIQIVDSNALGCPRIDTTIVLLGLNPIAVKPTVTTVGSLCTGDSAIHRILIQNTNAGANYYDLFLVGLPSPIAGFAGSADSTQLYTSPASSSPIQNLSSLYVIATDTLSGCSKISDTLLVNVFEAPVVGFTAVSSGLELTLTDTTSVSVSRNWYFKGAIPDEMDAQAIVSKMFPASGVYTVWMGGQNRDGCYGYSKQDIELFNTGLNSALDQTISVEVFPNPALDDMTLDIKLPSASSVQVDVYDIRGEIVTSLARPQISTNHHILWNGSELKPGVYYLKVTTNSAIKIEKLLIRQ